MTIDDEPHLVIETRPGARGVYWAEWEARPNRITLADGRTVQVARGDEVLVRTIPGGVRFLDHKAKIIH